MYMGTYYEDKVPTYRELLDNIDDIIKDYPLNNCGYFGEKGKVDKCHIDKYKKYTSKG